MSVGLFVGTQVLAQVSSGTCYEGLRVVDCDELNRAGDQTPESPSISDELQRRISRYQRITAEQEARVEEAMQERFQAPQQRKLDTLRGIVETALVRADAMKSLEWGSDNQRLLGSLIERLGRYASQLESEDANAVEISQLRDLVREDVKRLQELASHRPRAEVEPERIENIVTRIDDLVARVGTVLLELEREGVVVPQRVQSGHERAKEAVRVAKRSCSMRRPSGCLLLWDVLKELESIREPLCALPSNALAFCDR